jgi:hypothetical protein
MNTLLICILLSQQWSAPVNLGIPGIDDIYPQTCHKQQLYSNTLCLVWQAFQDDNWEIYSRFFNGSLWGDTIRVTDEVMDDTRPRVAFDTGSNQFWCVWERNGDIFAAYSSGAVWSVPEQVTSGVELDELPSIHCLNGEIWVVWQRTVSDSMNIFSSFHYGTEWSPAVPVTHEANVDNTAPVLSDNQNHFLAVWTRDNDIYYSTYIGSSWQAPQPITTSVAAENSPEVTSSVFSGTAVCWQTDEYGDWELYRTATDTFTTHYRVTNDSSDDVTPCPLLYVIPIRQWNVPMIAFASDRNGNTDIYSWIDWQGTIQIDDDPAQDIYPVLTANMQVYVWAIWQTDRNGDWDVYGSYQFMPGSVEETDAHSGVSIFTITPNPFNKKTEITLSTGRITDITVFKIYNATGRLVKNIPVPTHYSLLPTSVTWDGTDDTGKRLPSGTYFIRCSFHGGYIVKPVILLK